MPWAGSRAGRTGAFVVGAGVIPRTPGTLRLRLQEGPLLHNKAQTTFAVVAGLYREGGVTGLAEYPH